MIQKLLAFHWLEKIELFFGGIQIYTLVLFKNFAAYKTILFRTHTKMGLQKIIRKHKEKEKEMRVLILGLDNAGKFRQISPPKTKHKNLGKTTVVKKFKGEDINTISPTLGFNIDTLEFAGINLNFWDIGGQASLRSYWKNYYENTDGKFFVV